MRLATKVNWEDLAAKGIPAGDIKQLTHFPDGSTEVEFVDPIREAAEMNERQAMAKADTLIDAITDLPSAKAFLKRLCAYLIKRGVL